MRTKLLALALMIAFLAGCSTPQSTLSDKSCTSNKIEEADQCLIGKPLGHAIELLELVRSRVVQKANEPNAYRYQWGDMVIEFFCIGDKSLPAAQDNPGETLETDSDPVRAILMKPVSAIRWSNDGGANMHYAGNWVEKRQKRV
jgi:hypothetical protein